MAEKQRWDGWLGPKQWMPILGVLSVAVIALTVVLLMNLGEDDDAGSSGNGRVPTHEHADFALFIRGQKFDFDKPEFLISEDETPKSNNVHLHVPRPNVVHVHTTLTTWDEFFSSIGFTLTDPSFPGITGDRVCMTLPDGTKLCNNAATGETWKFVANGVPVDGMANVNIGELARVLFSYGPETIDTVLKEQWTQMTDQACIVSELCLDRVDPNEPPENCGGQGVCSK